MRRALVALCALGLLLGACKGGSHPSAPSTTHTTAPPKPVRVGVWTPADPSANTYGGAAVRSLIYPQLFRAAPDGHWRAALVQPGSDKTDPGATSARFRLRPHAQWSDGSPITVSDLRRSLDGRFVSAVDDPVAPNDTIVVHFRAPFPGWRQLWSGLAQITPPHDGVYGGAYKLGSVTTGLETEIVANPSYYGPRPAIADVHLVLVPDPEIAARLMERGELDVIAPTAYTGRTPRLERIKHAHVVATSAGGWTATLVTNPARLNPAQRQFLLAYANGPRFTDVLLHDEATPTGGVVPAPSPAASFPRTPAFTVPSEAPPAGVLLHAMQRRAHRAGFDFDVRSTEFDDVVATFASGDFDVVLRLQPNGIDVCWTCSYAPVDADLAKRSDAGDASARSALQAKLTGDGLELPLWRERPVAAVRNGLENVTENGFDVAGPLWDLPSWRWANSTESR